jgi:[histone H3]-lysine36 N-dimethyltransferase SETMAR
MHLVFFDHTGVIYDHWVPQGQTVELDILFVSFESPVPSEVAKKRPDLATGGWILHHDNAPAHRSRVCQDVLEEIGVELMVHPAYSPDLAPCDFFLFPELKNHLRGNRYQSDSEVNAAVSGVLKVLSKDGLWSVMEAWQNRWTKCIESEGHYFEGA